MFSLVQLSSGPEPVRTTTAPAPTHAASAQPDNEASAHDEHEHDAHAAETSVAAFLSAWLTTDQSQQNWIAALRPHITDQLATGLAATDPARVPTGPLLNMQPVLVGDYVAVFTAELTATSVEVEAVFEGARWLVSDIRQSG